jgi:hypothetical protein
MALSGHGVRIQSKINAILTAINEEESQKRPQSKKKKKREKSPKKKAAPLATQSDPAIMVRKDSELDSGLNVSISDNGDGLNYSDDEDDEIDIEAFEIGRVHSAAARNASTANSDLGYDLGNEGSNFGHEEHPVGASISLGSYGDAVGEPSNAKATTEISLGSPSSQASINVSISEGGGSGVFDPPPQQNPRKKPMTPIGDQGSNFAMSTESGSLSESRKPKQQGEDSSNPNPNYW